uniref:Transmembrane protein n=1 Tax=Davidia involucrata TaxID=16924 RepID=A0A5B7BF63_DAVIN
MATAILHYVQTLWPLKFDDLRASERLVRKLSVPEHTKQFVFAIREPESQAVIYVLCAQNLSERSALDAEHLIREIRPDAVVAQVGGNSSVNEIQSEEIELRNYIGDPVPTSSFEVLKRCFVHKINKEKYENVAGSLVLREIFGISFHGHFLAAKRVAEEVGSSFFLLESPFVKAGGDNNPSGEADSGNKFQALALQPRSLVPQKVGSIVPSSSRRFYLTNDLHSQIVKSLSSYLNYSSSVLKVNSGDFQPTVNYEAPSFAQSIYPLLVDLHNIFADIPSIGRALAHAQRMLYDVNRGEIVDTQLLREVYIFRIAVEGLRIALNSAGRLPINKIGSAKTEFSELPVEDKSHALLAQALRSQTKKFKSIVAIVDASGLAGLRKHWNTHVPPEVKDMVEQLATKCESDGEISNYSDRNSLLTSKPVVAVGAGATAVLGASSLSKVVPASTFMKIVTFKIPASLNLILTQTQKAVAIALSKTLGPSKVVAPGFASTGAKATSALKATVSAEKIRAVAHSVIASAERTSLSTMRTAFYEIMRKRQVRPLGFLPWATFGCSIATCTGLLVYGDGIECAAESLPAAPSIASLGRGIQSLHQASQAARQAESFKIQKSIESLMNRFKKVKAQ